MPAIQTTYGDLRAGVAGQLATMVPSTLISRSLESASAAFGIAVSQGTEDDECATYSDNFLGLTVRERSLPAEQDNYLQGDNVRLLVKGAIFATAAVAVAAGDPVHIVAGGALSNTGGTAIPGARWDTSTSGASQLAVVRID